jgi:hypothetical protein
VQTLLQVQTLAGEVVALVQQGQTKTEEMEAHPQLLVQA